MDRESRSKTQIDENDVTDRTGINLKGSEIERIDSLNFVKSCHCKRGTNFRGWHCNRRLPSTLIKVQMSPEELVLKETSYSRRKLLCVICAGR
jgi:hypothetical protein